MSSKVITESVDFEGIKMNYARFGCGSKNFVMVPGLSVKEVTLSAQAVAAAYAEFSNEYTVWLFDRRQNPPEQYSIRAMAADTVKVMSSLGINRADFFGASQGGMICQYIAIDYPSYVNRLVLASTLCRPGDYTRSVLEGWIDCAKTRNGQKLVSDSVDKIYSPATLSAYREAIISSMSEISEEEFRRFVIIASAIRDFDTSSLLDKITCPVLVIGSRGDKVVTAAGSEELAELLKCPVYLYGENFGHAVYDEAPDFKKRLLDFYSE